MKEDGDLKSSFVNVLVRSSLHVAGMFSSIFFSSFFNFFFLEISREILGFLARTDVGQRQIIKHSFALLQKSPTVELSNLLLSYLENEVYKTELITAFFFFF